MGRQNIKASVERSSARPVLLRRSPLITGEAFYVGVREKLAAVEAADGKTQTLLEDKDYEFVPLAVEGDLLIARYAHARFAAFRVVGGRQDLRRTTMEN